MQKKWQNKTSDGYRSIISGFLFFGLRPKSPSDPQLYYKKYDLVVFCLIFSGIFDILKDLPDSLIGLRPMHLRIFYKKNTFLRDFEEFLRDLHKKYKRKFCNFQDLGFSGSPQKVGSKKYIFVKFRKFLTFPK